MCSAVHHFMDALGALSSLNSIMGSKPSKIVSFSGTTTVGVYNYAVCFITKAYVIKRTSSSSWTYPGIVFMPIICPHGSSVYYSAFVGADVGTLESYISYANGTINPDQSIGYVLLYN